MTSPQRKKRCCVSAFKFPLNHRECLLSLGTRAFNHSTTQRGLWIQIMTFSKELKQTKRARREAEVASSQDVCHDAA